MIYLPSYRTNTFAHGILGLVHRRLRLLMDFIFIGLLSVLPYTKLSGQQITDIHPQVIERGAQTTIEISGTGLTQDMKFISMIDGLTNQVVSASPTKLQLSIGIPEHAELGPSYLWFATRSGIIKRHLVLVDDLKTSSEGKENHSFDFAQAISIDSSIEGTCDGVTEDYYQFTVREDQKLFVAVLVQCLRSTMDPVVELMDHQGSVIEIFDDHELGPDCLFSYSFSEAGKYYLKIYDSRHAAVGSTYQLRVTGAPIAMTTYPLAAMAGTTVNADVREINGRVIRQLQVAVPEQKLGVIQLDADSQDNRRGNHVPLMCFPYKQVLESEVVGPLVAPVGINGCLSASEEIDRYTIDGKKDQTIRVQSNFAILGSPTLACVKLSNEAGDIIARTSNKEPDSWTLTSKLPADGKYFLEIYDLLGRGGDPYIYSLQCTSDGSFSISLKPDPKAKEDFIVPSQKGAFSLDLQIQRFGYDGAINLSLLSESDSLTLLNPVIPAGATEAKIFIASAEHSQSEQLELIRLLAKSSTQPQLQCSVDCVALRRVKEPHVAYPVLGSETVIAISTGENPESFFQFKKPETVRFAKPLLKQTVTVEVVRANEKFKSPVYLATPRLNSEWDLSDAAEGDRHQLTLQRTNAYSQPAEVNLPFFGELDGVGLVESCNLKIDWFDPVSVRLDVLQPAVQGGLVVGELVITREGKANGPVTIHFKEMPQGYEIPMPVEISADKTVVPITFAVGEEASLDEGQFALLEIVSQYGDEDFTTEIKMSLPDLVEKPISLSVYPDRVRLTNARDQQQLVVTGFNRDGSIRDWTQDATFTLSNVEFAKVNKTTLLPVRDGNTVLRVEAGGLSHEVPVEVINAERSRPVEFESEVLTALSKKGCNSGACHGSPSGKGGFRLSLRAFDKKLDELTLIRENFGRRVNPIEPDKSLLLTKPLMKVSHGGNRQLREGEVSHEIIRQWIAEGAKADSAEKPRISALKIFPSKKRILRLRDEYQQLAVTANDSNGQSRDITNLATYQSSDANIATVDENGLIRAIAKGEVAILVRLLEHVETLQVLVVDEPIDSSWQSPPPANYIDEIVNEKLRLLNYPLAPLCSDDEFLRRASFDLLGVLPAINRTQEFLNSNDPNKRRILIDEFLDDPQFAKYWALKWGDLLKMTQKSLGDQGVFKYHRWVESAFRQNMPYDQFAANLLTSSGSTFANPEANFFKAASDVNESVETVSQVFLGARLQCAKCHNHPFERWTQDNYYGLAAFFNRVQQRKTQRPGETQIFTVQEGEVTQPRTGQVMQPWVPGGSHFEQDDTRDRRRTFANWLVDRGNPYFAKVEVNRIWSSFFYRGIVEPIDDFRDSNPPTNSKLLNQLADAFVDSGYDRKQLIRTIMNSRTYQTGYASNQESGKGSEYFSHQEPRLLGAEQIFDAINHVLMLPSGFSALPPQMLATQLPATDLVKIDFLKVFGQPERGTVCACERSGDANLGMAIELFNGDLIHQKLRDGNNRFRQLITAGASVEDVITELYLAAFCRNPTTNELTAAREHCEKTEDIAAAIEDNCWVIFNTDEFLFQH